MSGDIFSLLNNQYFKFDMKTIYKMKKNIVMAQHGNICNIVAQTGMEITSYN